MRTETPFMKFWAALNEECRARGLSEPTYGPARGMFQAALSRCERRDQRFAELAKAA